MPKRQNAKDSDEPASLPLSFFACPNGECADFNRFNSGNLSVAERMGKDKAIRRLYCKTCGTRFSEREGSLMQSTKLPEAALFDESRANLSTGQMRKGLQATARSPQIQV